MSYNGGRRFGGFGMPGQREQFRGGPIENLALVLKQTGWYIVLAVIATAIVLFDLTMLGPVVGFGLGCGAAAAFSLWTIQKARRATQAGFVTFLVLGALTWAVWLVGGWGLCAGLWPGGWLADWLRGWQVWVKMVALAISGGALEGLYLARYRFRYEIVDPKWSAPIKAREPDGPWMPSPFADLLEMMEEPERQEPVRLPARTVNVQVWQREGDGTTARAVDNFGLPGADDVWGHIAQKTLSGGQAANGRYTWGFTEGHVKKLLGGRETWQRARGILIEQSFLAWNDPGNHQQGTRWTRRGELWLFALLGREPERRTVAEGEQEAEEKMSDNL